MTPTKTSVAFTADEPWTTVTCEDGTKIKLRSIVKDVQRMEGEWDADGNPLYQFVSQQIVFLSVPEYLMRAARSESVN